MKQKNKHKKIWLRALLVMILGMASTCLFAQTNPTDSLPGDPGAIQVTTAQNMAFGAFSSSGSGGSVIISTSGSRSATGGIVPLNMGRPYFQAIFDIKAPQGTIISILFGPDATLSGSNGGTMTLHLSGSSPSSPFITTVPETLRTPINIGGILNVGSPGANPPGSYNGTFYITFNQE